MKSATESVMGSLAIYEGVEDTYLICMDKLVVKTRKPLEKNRKAIRNLKRRPNK